MMKFKKYNPKKNLVVVTLEIKRSVLCKLTVKSVINNLCMFYWLTEKVRERLHEN